MLSGVPLFLCLDTSNKTQDCFRISAKETQCFSVGLKILPWSIVHLPIHYLCPVQLFYVPHIQPNATFTLPPDEVRHCLKVLRKRVGDTVHVTDGLGHLYLAELIADRLDDCQLKVVSAIADETARAYKVTIALAPTHDADRLEWFIEKATELGIDAIQLVITSRTERFKYKPERLQKILLGALKQSGRATLPVLDEPQDWKAFMKSSSQYTGKKLIAACFGERKSLKDLYQSGQDVLVLIGPEGDFTLEEVNMAVQSGFQPVTLGAARLRVETAALATLQTIHVLNG
ncbi:16S rRNA (uracil(1498)-N(3))-methyltransferase [soil metagenome]